MVLIVRTDLKMERGKVASQCAHAAVICYHQALNSTNSEQSELAKSWFFKGQSKIVLKAESEKALQELYKLAVDSNLNAALVHDAGHTQVKQGSLTVVGIGPNEKSLIDNVTSHLKLY